MKRMLTLVAMAVIFAAGFAGLTGCEDEVRTTHKVERVEESPPHMVSPGEPVVDDEGTGDWEMVSPGEPIVE